MEQGNKGFRTNRNVWKYLKNIISFRDKTFDIWIAWKVNNSVVKMDVVYLHINIKFRRWHQTFFNDTSFLSCFITIAIINIKSEQ